MAHLRNFIARNPPRLFFGKDRGKDNRRSDTPKEIFLAGAGLVNDAKAGRAWNPIEFAQN
jgi:hypothetical protein